jgi:tripartite-type tricarboxylate transporter receptor subunit TctC
MKTTSAIGALAAAWTLALGATGLRAQSVEDFYRGKQIRVIIGYSAGGGYDLSARLVTKHMAKFIPGHPTMVPQNMPGAGSATAAQYMMRSAPRDGTVLATLGQNIPFDQVMHPERASTYDASKMNWIGNADEQNNVIMIWRASGVRSIKDAFTREIVLGATAADGADALYPRVLNNVLGAKFKIIGGFPGGADQNLAMERGETEGRGSQTMSSIRATTPQFLKENKIVIILQMGVVKSPELPDVPLMVDLARSPAERAIFQLVSAGVRLGRTILTTPDVPADRLKALREAFDKTMKDPEFLADAKAANLDINPVSGVEVQKAVEDVVNASPDAIALARAAITPGKPFNCEAIARDKSMCRAK